MKIQNSQGHIVEVPRHLRKKVKQMLDNNQHDEVTQMFAEGGMLPIPTPSGKQAVNRYPEGGKIEPYHTSDPNDPRIQAYRDSSDLSRMLYSNMLKSDSIYKRANDRSDKGLSGEKSISNLYFNSVPVENGGRRNIPGYNYSEDIDKPFNSLKKLNGKNPELSYLSKRNDPRFFGLDSQPALFTPPKQKIILSKPQIKETIKPASITKPKTIIKPVTNTVKPEIKKTISSNSKPISKPVQTTQTTTQQVTPQAQAQINTGNDGNRILRRSSPDSTTGKRLYRLGDKDITEEEFNKYKSMGNYQIKEYRNGGRIKRNFGGTVGNILQTAAPMVGMIPGVGTLAGGIIGAAGTGIGQLANHEKFDPGKILIGGASGALGAVGAGAMSTLGKTALQAAVPVAGQALDSVVGINPQSAKHGGSIQPLNGGAMIDEGNGVEHAMGASHENGGMQYAPNVEIEGDEKVLDGHYVLTDEPGSNLENNKMSISKRFDKNSKAISSRNGQEINSKATEFLKQNAMQKNEKFLALRQAKMMNSINRAIKKYGGKMYGGGGSFADPTGNKDWTYDQGENGSWTGYRGGKSFPLSGNPKYQSSIDRLNATYNPIQPMNTYDAFGKLNTQKSVSSNSGQSTQSDGFRFYEHTPEPQLYPPINDANQDAYASNYRGYPENQSNNQWIDPRSPYKQNNDQVPYSMDYTEPGNKRGIDWGNIAQQAGIYAPVAYNLAKGIFDKADTLNPADYMQKRVNASLIPENTGQNEINDGYNRSYYDMKNSGNYSRLGQVALQNNRVKNDYERKLRLKSANVGINNQTNQFNAGIDSQNINARLGISDYNNKSKAAKQGLVGTGLGQLSQGIQNDRNNRMDLEALNVMYPNKQLQSYLESRNYRRRPKRK